ncbi:MAG TPA: Stk1 family PASTA domain-containing Ser/Thr kinase [Tissierellales bacterium]|nr:Stk1 family PASTA domain-containing Ser/Thr kinase [Tissierellales bacterium]
MIGKVLGGRYEIKEKVGGGGMGIVYKARCRLLNRFVAVKVLREEFVSDEQFIKNFRKESQAAASLSHPNIVGIYDVGVEKGEEHDIHYIVMEYVDGKTLSEVIKEKGRLSPKETIDYSLQIAEALEHAHKNQIIHRDIKPHNIMVTKDGRIKVTDFGIARAATSSTLTATSSVVGSAHYFSPEQARGGFTDEKSDIYSLGIVMYEMITGSVPFNGDSPISIALKHVQEEVTPPSEINSDVPQGIEAIINKCLRKNSVERYKDARELIADLNKVKYSDGKEVVVDDISESLTQIIPAITDDDLKGVEGKTDREKKDKEEGKEKIKDKDKDEPKKNKGNKKYVLLGVLLAFLLATGMFIGVTRARDLFAKEVEVPDLVGRNEDEAKKLAEDLGLVFKVKESKYSSEFSEGYIISQSEKPGKLLKEGYPIEVVVSKGKKLIEVPDLKNRNVDEIKDILKDAGLKDGSIDYRYSDSVPANIVMEQDPNPYTEVPEDTVVNVIVSKGPERVTVTMPNLIGQNIKDAKNAIIAAGLAVGEVIPKESKQYSKDIVIWQNYQAGGQVNKNTVVTLHVSSGPPKEKPKEEKISVPGVIGQSEKDAKNAIVASGLSANVKYEYSDQPKGIVIKQNPSAGNKVKKNTTVTLIVSKGPKSEEPEPSEPGEPEEPGEPGEED